MLIRNVMFLAFALMLGCSPSSPLNGSGSGGPTEGPYAVTGDKEVDWEGILKLEAEAKALVKAEGCSAGQCRTAPVGSRACGGPRYYLVYCARTTDSAALFAKLDAVAAAERAYNVKYQVMSTCEFRTPPHVGVTGAMCAAQSMGDQTQ